MARGTVAAEGIARLRAMDWRRISQPDILLTLLVVVVIGYLALVPLGYLLWSTFFDERGLTFEFFREAYSTYGLSTMVANSLWFALGSTVIAVSLGTTLAYLIVRTDVPFRKLMFAAALVPLVIPGILHTIAWIFLASPRIGLFNKLLEPLVGPGFFDVFSIWGMMLVEGLHLSPLVFLLMAAAFRSMDPSLEESAVMSGARLPTVFRHITLPLAKPALFAAVLIMIVRGLEAFEVPALLGIPDGTWVFTSRIWRALNEYPRSFGQAGAYSVSLLIITSIGVWLYSRLSRETKSYQTITGRGLRPRRLQLGRWRWPATLLIVGYFLLAVVMPLLILLYSSTQKFYSVPSLDSLSDMTLENYRHTFSQDHVLRALKNSLVLGIASATAVMLAMSVASWLVVRTKIRARWAVDNLAFTPLAIPGLVMGVSILFVYLRHPVPIYGTIWILLIAYMTRYMPYGMRYATVSMYQISGELEESAQTSGATWWQTFRRVILPLLVPGLMAGWIYIVLVSVRELSSSILLYSPGNEVLSVVIWEQWQNGQYTELASLGMVMVIVLLVLVALAYRVGARIGIREP